MTRRTVIGRGQGGRSNGCSTNDLGQQGVAGEGASVGRAACNGHPAHGAKLLNASKHKHASARRASNSLSVLVARPFSRGFDRVPSRSAHMRGYVGAEGRPQSPQEKDAFVSPYRDRARPEPRPIPNASPGGLPVVPLAFAPGEGARARRGGVSHKYRLARIG
jgi:hypothetical protein